tara:strand:- start:41 stop:217 length:177 start_codon:yes stop_codon:yes gene_type:complete
MAEEITKKRDWNKVAVKSLVDLWYETQLGHYKKCQEKQFEFADLMWNLYKEFHPEDGG